MARLRVQFKQVEHGWAQTFFWIEEEEYERWFSYVFRNVFADLCEALSALINDSPPQIVIWLSEPEEHEMHFSKEGDRIKLEMWRFEDHQRGISTKRYLEFSISGTYDEICLPFWRALRTLQGLYDEKEFERRWRGQFPTRALAQLTPLLGKA